MLVGSQAQANPRPCSHVAQLAGQSGEHGRERFILHHLLAVLPLRHHSSLLRNEDNEDEEHLHQGWMVFGRAPTQVLPYYTTYQINQRWPQFIKH